MRFADQWQDLYGAGWVSAAIGLYAEGIWRFADVNRLDGFSVVLFGKHGLRYKHPPRETIEAALQLPSISSVQTTFHENREPHAHAMPPGGFRLAIINCADLGRGFEARRMIADAYPSGCLLSPLPESCLAASAETPRKAGLKHH